MRSYSRMMMNLTCGGEAAIGLVFGKMSRCVHGIQRHASTLANFVH